MMWLSVFGAFIGGVIKGWVGESKPTKLDKLAPKDRGRERTRKAKETILSRGS